MSSVESTCQGSVIITGASSGIGIETAEALAEARAEITLAVRNPDAGEEVAARLRISTGNPEIHVRRLDLADLHSVRAFSSAWSGPLHILVNNAGIMANPELERTPKGFEIQFATNFLGHFLLTTGLRNALVAANGARVVSLSSSANTYAPVLFDGPHFRFMPYSPFVAYGQSKTANILFAVELTRRWAANCIFSNALNPGAIATNLSETHRRPEDTTRTAEDPARRRCHICSVGRVAIIGRGRRPVL
jgi:NAD(P)-dependent dehydrogenase (short-subunit alcohol dehydrogenase family)